MSNRPTTQNNASSYGNAVSNANKLKIAAKKSTGETKKATGDDQPMSGGTSQNTPRKNTKSYLLAVNNVAKFEGKNDAKGANDTDNKSRSNVVED